MCVGTGLQQTGAEAVRDNSLSPAGEADKSNTPKVSSDFEADESTSLLSWCKPEEHGVPALSEPAGSHQKASDAPADVSVGDDGRLSGTEPNGNIEHELDIQSVDSQFERRQVGTDPGTPESDAVLDFVAPEQTTNRNDMAETWLPDNIVSAPDLVPPSDYFSSNPAISTFLGKKENPASADLATMLNGEGSAAAEAPLLGASTPLLAESMSSSCSSPRSQNQSASRKTWKDSLAESDVGLAKHSGSSSSSSSSPASSQRRASHNNAEIHSPAGAGVRSDTDEDTPNAGTTEPGLSAVEGDNNESSDEVLPRSGGED